MAVTGTPSLAAEVKAVYAKPKKAKASAVTKKRETKSNDRNGYKRTQ